MTISGFTFVRNAILYDFPLRESLESLLQLCDEIVVAVGASDDATLDAVRSVDSRKIKVIETVWDDSKREGGRVYAEQTDIALARCSGDWCVYLQADEVLHEDDIDTCRRAIEEADADPRIEALIFRYLHFYGSYDYVGAGRTWYRREVRAVRNTGEVISWGDAQGFRKKSAKGEAVHLRALQCDVRVFHYGWVRSPKVQGRKQQAAHRYWHDDHWIEEHIPSADAFDYSGAHELVEFQGSHPRVMQKRISDSVEWTRHFDPSRTRRKPLLMALTDWIERRTGYRIGEYRNFEEIS